MIYHGYKKSPAKAIYFDGKNFDEVIAFSDGNVKLVNGTLSYLDPIPEYDSLNKSNIPNNRYIIIASDPYLDTETIEIYTKEEFLQIFDIEIMTTNDI